MVMEPIRVHEGKVCPLNRANVDTDQIVPKQFLKRIERQGFGQFLFYHWRYDHKGNERSDFVLNNPIYKGASILVSGDNFGCGSSREHAPWALLDFGFKVIIAPSFADIFYNNCLQNGILPIVLSEEETAFLMEKAEVGSLKVRVDLPEQTVHCQAFHFTARFDIDPYRKQCLLNGWDEIALTLQLEDKIRAFEEKWKEEGENMGIA